MVKQTGAPLTSSSGEDAEGREFAQKVLHEPCGERLQSSAVSTHNGPYKWLQIKMAVLVSVPQPTQINWVDQTG